MDDLKQIIAKNITELRHSREITQASLAEQLNYSDKAVSKWERGESVPDITVLMKIADFFEVPLDYLVHSEHKSKKEKLKVRSKITLQNHGFITGMCILLVWLIAALVFVITDMLLSGTYLHWLVFAYAVPVTMIVWLVFNSIWFNRRRNFLIISLLMWSVLVDIYITLICFGFNVWTMFGLGVIGQIIIFMWSKLRYKREEK